MYLQFTINLTRGLFRGTELAYLGCNETKIQSKIMKPLENLKRKEIRNRNLNCPCRSFYCQVRFHLDPGRLFQHKLFSNVFFLYFSFFIVLNFFCLHVLGSQFESAFNLHCNFDLNIVLLYSI